MADFDWGGLIQQGLSAATGYVQSQMQFKQAKKLAKLQAGTGSGAFPMLGTGNMSFGYSSSPMAYAGGPMGPIQTMGGFGPQYGVAPGTVDAGLLGRAYNYVTGADAGANVGCPTLFVPRMTSGVRALPLVFQQGPDGSMHYWRHVGAPVEFSRDRALCKAYLKRHGGGLGRRRKY